MDALGSRFTKKLGSFNVEMLYLPSIGSKDLIVKFEAAYKFPTSPYPRLTYPKSNITANKLVIDDPFMEHNIEVFTGGSLAGWFLCLQKNG